MAPDDVAASVNKPSFVPGETIRLTLHFEAAAEDLGAVSNVSVNFYRVEAERNQFAFGFGNAPIQQGNTLALTQALPETIPCGLYLVHHVNLSRGDTQEASVGENIRFDPGFPR